MTNKLFFIEIISPKDIELIKKHTLSPHVTFYESWDAFKCELSIGNDLPFKSEFAQECNVVITRCVSKLKLALVDDSHADVSIVFVSNYDRLSGKLPQAVINDENYFVLGNDLRFVGDLRINSLGMVIKLAKVEAELKKLSSSFATLIPIRGSVRLVPKTNTAIIKLYYTGDTYTLLQSSLVVCPNTLRYYRKPNENPPNIYFKQNKD
jgi:hypothetical protein